MSPYQLAAVLAAVVLVAIMVSVELGVTVALIELTLGVVAGNVFDLTQSRLARLHRRVRLDRAHIPRRDGGRPGLHARPCSSVGRDRRRVVHRPVRRRVARRLLPPRLDAARRR